MKKKNKSKNKEITMHIKNINNQNIRKIHLFDDLNEDDKGLTEMFTYFMCYNFVVHCSCDLLNFFVSCFSKQHH